MHWVGESSKHQAPEFQGYQARGRGYWVRGRGRGRFYGRSRGRGRGRFNSGGNRLSQTQVGSSENSDKGAKPSILDRVVFPETKGKEKEVSDSKNEEDHMKDDMGDDLYDDEFVEDEMVAVVSILPAEFANSSQECLDGNFYDPAQGDEFLLVRPQREAVTDFSGHSTPAMGLVMLTVQIHGVGAVPSTVHQCLLLWNDNGTVDRILADDSLYMEQMHVDFKVYNDNIKPINVQHELNSSNCDGCFMTNQGLNLVLRGVPSGSGVVPTGWE
ncbi:hypothetical protein PIB30_000233 [Stylosanthes scabra]|uniref:Uncharacterized protein n=1 Tax=Stylosanthes scabra TaxID=79078 RepID=A0ABU6S2R9_9FABA|nr:hypothetical protein [Stylosanthes scabra]